MLPATPWVAREVAGSIFIFVRSPVLSVSSL